MVMKALNDAGSTTVEVSIAIAFLALVLSGGLLSTYFAFARVWLSRSAYEGVICLSTDASESECKRKTKARIENALPIGRITKIVLKRSKKTASVEMRFEVAGQVTFQVRERRKLPLKYDGAYSL